MDGQATLPNERQSGRGGHAEPWDSEAPLGYGVLAVTILAVCRARLSYDRPLYTGDSERSCRQCITPPGAGPADPLGQLPPSASL